MTAEYQVYAVGDGTAYTDSDLTSINFIRPVAVQLSAPTGLSIQEAGGAWTATWDAVANASGYRFQKVGGSGWHDCSGTSYTFVNAPGTAEYQVYAVGDGYEYTDSDIASVNYTKPAEKLGKPTGFTMQSDGTSWTLDWDSVSNASSYMFCQTNGSGNWYSCTDSSYTFVNQPQAGDAYAVYAVGDGTAYTNGEEAAYTYNP